MADGAKSDHPAVQKQLDRLSMLSPGRDVLGLERISAVMARLGNQHKNLPPVFHVAGTNGKGSTCAFLRAAIEAEGLTAHVYSSPHLVRFNERIRLAGSLIEDDYLAKLLARVLDASEDINPSFFEATTAAAFLAFSETPADACILEVGLGGRLDATNIIERPVVCAIAALGIDHEAFLLAQEKGTPSAPLNRIAWEKAGIAKAGVPLVTQKYTPEMLQVISDHAASIGATHLPSGTLWNSAVYKDALHYKDESGALHLPLPALPGEHQTDNAALAIAMLRHQNAISISDAAFRAAMGWAKWPARLQKLAEGPLTQLLSGTEIWLDGGHNPSAGEALAKHFAENANGLHLVIAMLENKNPSAIIEPLGSVLKSITVIPVPDHDCHKADAFKSILPISSAKDIKTALTNLALKKPKQVLIAGSLYLAGEILRLNQQVPD